MMWKGNLLRVVGFVECYKSLIIKGLLPVMREFARLQVMNDVEKENLKLLYGFTSGNLCHTVQTLGWVCMKCNVQLCI
jgi:hypothetical protein